MAHLFTLPLEIREMIWEMCCLDPGLFFLPSRNLAGLEETKDLVAALSPPRHSNTMWICYESRTVAQKIITRQAPECQAAVPHRRYRPEIDIIVIKYRLRTDYMDMSNDFLTFVLFLEKVKASAKKHEKAVFDGVAHIALSFYDYDSERRIRYAGCESLFTVFPRLQRLSLCADPKMTGDRSLTTFELVPVAEDSDCTGMLPRRTVLPLNYKHWEPNYIQHWERLCENVQHHWDMYCWVTAWPKELAL